MKQDPLDKLLDDLESGVSPEISKSITPKIADLVAATQQSIDIPIQTVRKSDVQSNSESPMTAVIGMLTKIKDEFETVSEDILGKWQADRDQIQSVIEMFLKAIGTDPNQVARPIIEGLVKLLDTKVNSSLMAVKLLEVKTKLLVALKGNSSVIINQNISNNQDSELTEILSQPEESDL